MAWPPFDTTPEVRRRAMTPDEVTRLLTVCPPERRLLYETALFSGLRSNELRHLTLEHLDRTKNREEGFQPLPRALLGPGASLHARPDLQRVRAVA